MDRSHRSLCAALWRGVLNLVFPGHCACCGARLEPARPLCLCPVCWNALPRIAQPYCPRCGKPVRGRSLVPYDTLCGECRKGPRAAGICRCAGTYEGPLKECIRLFKYEGRRELARPLGLFMGECARGALMGEPYDGLVPVPLHRAKLRERGFNQALLLARELAGHLGSPVIAGALSRVAMRPSQSTLARAERLKNVKGLFSVRDGGAVRGKRLLLVDDVYTTGATAGECARVLIEGGARGVDIFTLARGV